MAKREQSILTARKDAVKNPSAHNANLCSLLEQLNPVIRKALYLTSVYSTWPIALRVLLDMQLKLGLRISEVLRLRPIDILSMDKVRIRASKRGRDRLVNYTDIYGYLNICKKTGMIPFLDYDRFFIYRLYKKEGLMLFHEKDKKYSVTHAFRHLLVQEITRQVEDVSLLSELVGHKSRKSIDSYLPKK